MKSLFLSLMVLATFALAAPASADWGHGPGNGPGWNGPGNGPDWHGPGNGPDWHGPGNGPGNGPEWGRQCQVIYDVCMFNISGFCVKWNNKAFRMECHEAYNRGCWEAERREGQHVRNCHIAQ